MDQGFYVDVAVPTVPLYGNAGPMVPMIGRGPVLVNVGPSHSRYGAPRGGTQHPLANQSGFLGDAGCGSCCDGCASGGGCAGDDHGHSHSHDDMWTRKHAGIPTWGWLALFGSIAGVLSFSHQEKF